jgi:hypothetical protein
MESMKEHADRWIQKALDADDKRLSLPLNTPERFVAETECLIYSTCATELYKGMGLKENHHGR